MDKNQLLESAKQIHSVSEKTFLEYQAKAELLISKINLLMTERKDIESLIGTKNVDMLKDNNANHVLFMTSIFKEYHPEIFVETVLWVFRAYRSHGFSENYWPAQLNAWMTVLKDTLTQDGFSEIYAYYNWLIINIPSFVELTDKSLEN
jgi:hypothetical protein